MKLFVVAALGAALVAGCAPFEHGHYTEDVSYRNTDGDPPGTPLVYQASSASRATYDPNAYAAIQGGTVQAQPSYASVAVAPQQYTASAPVTYSTQSYSAPVQQSYSAPIQQTYTAQPSYQTASYIQPAAQSTYSAHAGHNHAVHATTYGGVQVDADGYAICDIPFPAHRAHEVPRY